MAASYLDSCIVIYMMEGRPAVRQELRRKIFPPSPAEREVCVSDLARLECRLLPVRNSDAGLLAEYDAFFAMERVRCLPMPREVYDLATELRAEHRLKTPDALHLATAIEAGCDEFWTNDRRLVKAAAGRIEVVVPFQ